VTFEFRYVRAETIPNKILKDIKISVGPTVAAYKGIMKEIEDVVRGAKNFSPIYIEGLYGTGKTLVLRKVVYDVVSGPNKGFFKNVIPIYFYLGETDFLLMRAVEEYLSNLRSYVDKAIEHPVTIGEREDWVERVKVLEESINSVKEKIKEIKPRDEPRAFFEVVKEVRNRNYIPLVVFDEFERVIYTGDGLKSEGAQFSLAEFSRRYLELTRGHIFSGIFILASTRPLRELLKEAYEEARPHLRTLANELGISMEKIAEDFPMIRAHIVYDYSTALIWGAIDLEALAREYNMILHMDLIRIISYVLPTPRAIIQINNKLSLIITPEEKGARTVGLEKFYDVIRTEIQRLILELKKTYIDNRPLVPPRSKWLERFEALLQQGYYYISSKNMKTIEIAKILDLLKEEEKIDEKKLKQKIEGVIHKIYEVGLYEKIGPGEYILNPHILAFALGVERLPDGSSADLDTLINKIKIKIKEIREKKKRKEKEAENAERHQMKT